VSNPNAIENILADEKWVLDFYRKAKTGGYATLRIEVHQGSVSDVALEQKYRPSPEYTRIKEVP